MCGGAHSRSGTAWGKVVMEIKGGGRGRGLRSQSLHPESLQSTNVNNYSSRTNYQLTITT